jgi:23S rRNA (cytosine1962-C5)-methyltransferase
MKSTQILTTESSADYELLDSGEGQKLERFGKFVLARPDPQALWHKNLSAAEWKKADGEFTDSWNLRKTLPSKWQISLGGLKFWIRPSSFKHVGLFPEHEENWKWLGTQLNNGTKEPLDKRAQERPDAHGQAPEILNLFGYTGAATLACAKAGANVVHVDGSKAALSWARENAELSGLKEKPIRWILDDAHAFVKREIKRGRRYHGIIMDPPAFGHGPKNELWKIEENLLPLVDDCLNILADQPLFFLLNGYSAGYSAIAYENNLLLLKERFGGVIETGELAIEEARNPNLEIRKRSEIQSSKLGESRLLPAGIFARWSKGE